MKKTKWFVDENPVRIGVYERNMSTVSETDADLVYSYWDGEFWLISQDNVKDADKESRQPEGKSTSVYQHLPWRGVNKDA